MTAQKVTIVSGTPGGPQSFSAVRDLDGVLYMAYFDSAASPARTKIYKSTDDGATWAAESWSQSIGADASNAGGDDPVLICDEGNNVWCGMSRYLGTDTPHVIQRDEAGEIWGGAGVYTVGYYKFGTKTGVSSLQMILDASKRTAGIWNIIAAFISGGVVYIHEISGLNDRTIGGTAASGVRLASNSAGKCFLAYVDGGKLYYSDRAPKAADTTWTSPIDITDGSDTVQTVEAVTVDQFGLPAALYRYDGGGGKSYLKLVEVSTGTITYSRVDTATPTNYSHYPGNSLQYDSRGAVYVAGLFDVGGLGRAEPVRWEMVRPLGVTAWLYEAIESASSADSQWTYPMTDVNPDRNGFRPNRNYQGASFYYLQNNTDIRWYNTDPYPGTGGYPTVFSTDAGEPPYPEGDTATYSTIALEGEGTAATTFPIVAPQMVMTTGTQFVTDTHKFEAGYRATIARFETGRRWFQISFDNVNATDRDSVADFLEARLKDGSPFTWTMPDTETTVDVFIAAGRVNKRKIGPSQWALGEFLFAEKVVS